MNVNQNKSQSAPAFKVTGNWENQSKQLKGKFSQLTDSDLKFEQGKENDLLERVEKRLNKNREEVINIINKTNTENS
jgi:uncharacterized protein YjbJ (UPF0337 family)